MQPRRKRQHAQQRHGEARILIRRQSDITASLQGDLIIQLQFIGAETARQCQHGIPVGIVIGNGSGNLLRQRQSMQQSAQLQQRGLERQAARRHFIGFLHHRRAIAERQRIEYGVEVLLIHRTQHRACGCFINFSTAVCDGLIQ